MMRFQKGDKIEYIGPPQKRPPAVREIVEVTVTGYMWRYPDMGETCPSGDRNLFSTDETYDPSLLCWRTI